MFVVLLICATLATGTLWAHCHYPGVLQNPVFLHLGTLVLAGTNLVIMSVVEKPAEKTGRGEIDVALTACFLNMHLNYLES